MVLWKNKDIKFILTFKGDYYKIMARFQENEHPRDNDGKFSKKGASSLTPNTDDIPNIEKGNDEYFGRSIGAKIHNYDIKLPSGYIAHIAEGTYITNIKTFAGKGTKTLIREEDKLINEFGGKKGQWSKVKGYAILDYEGNKKKAEIHWYHEQSVGKVKVKFKRWSNES